MTPDADRSPARDPHPEPAQQLRTGAAAEAIAATSAPETRQVEIAPNDPIVAYFQSAHRRGRRSKASTSTRPRSSSLREAGVELVVPLVSQGELVGVAQSRPAPLGPGLLDRRPQAPRLARRAGGAGAAGRATRAAAGGRSAHARAHRAGAARRDADPAELPARSSSPSSRAGTCPAYYRPAREVGGDFYDFIELPDGRLGDRDRRRDRQGRARGDGDGGDAERPARLRAAHRRARRGARARQRPDVPGHAVEDVRHLPLRRARCRQRAASASRTPATTCRTSARDRHDRAARDRDAARAPAGDRLRGDRGGARAGPDDAAPLRRRRRGARAEPRDVRVPAAAGRRRRARRQRRRDRARPRRARPVHAATAGSRRTTSRSSRSRRARHGAAPTAGSSTRRSRSRASRGNERLAIGARRRGGRRRSVSSRAGSRA